MGPEPEWQFQWYGFDEDLNLYRRFEGQTSRTLQTMPWMAPRVRVWVSTDPNAKAPETIRPDREEIRAYKELARAQARVKRLQSRG